MPLDLPLKLTLVAATGVEVFAGASLVLAPERFVRKTYGGAAPVDALTVKYARCVAGETREAGCADAPARSLAPPASRSPAWACSPASAWPQTTRRCPPWPRWLCTTWALR